MSNPAVQQIDHDLAWTCGETQADGHGRRASYLRVWCLGPEGWKVRFDVRLPHPAPARGPQ